MQNIEMDKLQYKIYHENKIHTPDDFPYNTYLCSIPLDFQSVNLHWHDEVEIIVIKKGSGIVSVDLTTYSVSAGDIIFVLPGQLHAISQKDNEIMEYENILFKSSLLNHPVMTYAMTNSFSHFFQAALISAR